MMTPLGRSVTFSRTDPFYLTIGSVSRYLARKKEKKRGGHNSLGIDRQCDGKIKYQVSNLDIRILNPLLRMTSPLS